MNIYSDIGQLKGVGPKTKDLLNKCGIYNILDLLLYFPRDYEFLNSVTDLNTTNENEKITIKCELVEVKKDIRTKTGKILTTLVFQCNEQKILAKWFNQPYVKKNFMLGEKYNLVGKIKKNGAFFDVINPVIGCEDLARSKIVPKYSLKDSLSNNILVKLINQILDSIIIAENLTGSIVEKYNFVSLDYAIRNIHFPKDRDSLNKSKKRLKFQELFTYSIKIMMLKQHVKSSNGIAFKMVKELKDLKESLPFDLTSAQSRTIREILLDQKKSVPMNRLVQGDVGSGKTIVAIIAMFNVVKNGYQAVMMAPTEILANQHFAEVKKVLERFEIPIEILSGSTKNSEKLRIKEKIKSGESMIVIGTHALIEEDVEFVNLGIIVTDEQHRFGVHQRSKLINKGKEADVLVMTATPIPRTLSLYLYGDLDISIIDELPPGRQKIDTVFFHERHRNKAYELAQNQIKGGRQVYIVCPLIEENEALDLNSVNKLYDELKNTYFKDIPLEMLHGKMNGKSKEDVMDRFKKGEIKAIISTTVIEVGVNVPNATVMIVENAERFGLSQLHQLRGRVGRGSHKSYCILIAEANNNITKKRMQIMTQSNDGFFIAEQDLKIRGTGELFGIKQHGDSELILANIIEDSDILRVANMEAKKVINSNSEADKKLCNEVIKNLQKTSKYICFN